MFDYVFVNYVEILAMFIKCLGTIGCVFINNCVEIFTMSIDCLGGLLEICL